VNIVMASSLLALLAPVLPVGTAYLALESLISIQLSLVITLWRALQNKLNALPKSTIPTTIKMNALRALLVSIVIKLR
jgi:hypothetical protein